MINYLVGSIILLLVDLSWLILFMGSKFGKMVENIQGAPMRLNLIGAILSYILLCFGVTFYGINKVDPNNALLSSIINGGLWGLVSYGIFDFTNYAIFKDYELSTAIIDTLWGGFLCATTTFIAHKITLLIK